MFHQNLSAPHRAERLSARRRLGRSGARPARRQGLAQGKKTSCRLRAIEVKIQITRPGYGDSLHALQPGDQRYEALGDFARGLAQLFGELKTACQGNVTDRKSVVEGKR